MGLSNTLRNSAEDFETVQKALRAGLPLNRSLFSLLERWFGNVEISYPIAVMDLSQDERFSLTDTILGEMVQLCADIAGSVEEEDLDEEEALDGVSPKLDAAWRELLGANAEFVNAEFHDRTDGVDLEEFLEGLRHTMQMIADAMDIPFEHVRADMLSKPEIRAELRNHGINPDDV